MSEEKYSPEQIELTQKVVQEVILVLQNTNELLEEISEFKLDSFEDIISSLFAVIYTKLSSKKNQEIRDTALSRGIFTAIIFYTALFSISKGLERTYGYKLNNSIFQLIPYSMQENIGINQEILGVQKIKKTFRNNSHFSISTNIPLITDSIFILGGDKTRRVGCPYTQNSNGKELNRVLSDSLLNFLELLYQGILKNFLETYSNMPENKTPDYINVLLGRFEINLAHLEKNSQFFQKLR